MIVVLILSSMSYLYILEINLLSVDLLANIFSHSECCLCLSLTVRQDKNCLIFAVQNPLIMSHLFIFVFIFINLGDGSKRSFCGFCQRVFFLCFPLSFIVLGLTFRSLIHFSLFLCMLLGSILISLFYM